MLTIHIYGTRHVGMEIGGIGLKLDVLTVCDICKHFRQFGGILIFL